MDRLIKNASWIIVGKIIQSFLGLFISMLTARYLGPSNYGLINYAQSLVVFVTPIMTLGFNNTLVMELIKSPSEEGVTLGTALLSTLISSILCIILIIVFVCIFDRADKSTIIVCVLFSTVLVFQSLEQIEYWYQAKLLSKYKTIISLASYIFVSLYKIYLLAEGKSVYWFAVSYMIDYLIISISLIFLYKKLGGSRLLFSFEKFKAMFNQSKPFIVSSMMVAIFTQTDKIMIDNFMTSADTGYYSAAATTAGITTFFFQAIIDSYRPLIFEKARINLKKAERVICQLYNIILYIALVQCLLMTCLAKPIISILYGTDYNSAILALQIIVWFNIFSFIGVIRNIWILVVNQQKYITYINMFGAGINIILNWLLIPRYGIYGASIATLITQMFTNVVVSELIRAIRYNNKLILKALDPFLFIKSFRAIYKSIK